MERPIAGGSIFFGRAVGPSVFRFLLLASVLFSGIIVADAQAKKPTGTLTVEVRGLPNGSSADVTVKGKGLRRSITKSGRSVLRKVPLGRYSIKAKAVPAGGSQAIPLKRSLSVVLSKKNPKGTATVEYRQTPPPPPVTYRLSVTKSGTGTGTITSTPAAIDCGSSCSGSFDQGTQVTLTATPASDSNFTGWSGSGCSGTGSCVVTMGEARSVAANFALNPLIASTISAGNHHTCAIRQSGQAVCWGWNLNGQLGNGTDISSDVPVNVQGLADAREISAGYHHTCAIRQSGQAACWGSDEFGQLGNGTETTSNVPVDVEVLGDAEHISSGGSHTCAIRQSGQAICWGRNLYGQLGDGTYADSAVPVNVQALTDAEQISSGGRHTCAIRQSSKAVCWGYNGLGQLGDGSSADGNLPGPATSSNVPVAVKDLGDAKVISAGGSYTCSVRQSGQAVCWGWNGYGQLGDGSTIEFRYAPVDVRGLGDATEISGRSEHTCATRQAGQAVCWGRNTYGQLGTGNLTFSGVPVNVQNLGDSVEISVGIDYSCAIRQSGQAVCWGRNFRGELGNGTYIDSNVPVNVRPG